MNPPPEATYDNVDALKAACRQHAAAHLYSVTTKQSDYKMGVLLLHCGKSEHNHPQLTREAAHPSHRKMTNDVKVCILTLIRSEPSDEHVIARDVYNLKRQHRIEQLDGRTPMEALLSSLIKLDVPNTHCVDASGRLTRLAFTSTKDVQLTRHFGTILTMDCTYKMNRFKMPLLHIVSFACIGATFTSAIAFLSAKMIEDYEWALNTNKGFMGVMRYVLSWMQYKTYFVGAYVDKVSHFESSSSSRVEGAHSALKQRLQVSTGDMMTVVERVLQFLADQRSGAILFTQTCSMTSLMLWTRLGVREVVRQVSSVAFIKIHLQFMIAKEHAGRKVRPQPNPHFKTVMGLPSVTTIYDLCAANQSLPMSAVHKQWWLALHLQVANIINASRTKRL
ncbi:hypothetical protein CY35_06G114900 [Sphagnum magellanicum]|nr:hypothetical protein CY35_06G114900 [Sphagnum magellanicum]